MNPPLSKICLLLPLTLQSSLLPATPVAGYIIGLPCPNGHYLLIRRGQPTPLSMQILTQVQEGDTVAIDANQSILQYRDDQLNLKTVTYSQLPFTMPTTGKELEPSCDISLNVKRQSQALSSWPSVLEAKDVVDLRPDQPMLQLQLGSQSIITEVKYQDLAYTVHATGEVPTVKSNLVTWLGQWLTRANDQQLQQAVILRTRGETDKTTSSPSIVLLDKATVEQQLVAGDRSLAIVWKGGKPPFTLTLAHAGDTQVLATHLQTQHTRQKVSLSPGKYQLSVQDAQTQMPVTYQFTVVEKLPSPPDEEGLANIPEANLRQVSQAAWLASDDLGRGKWLWEAYQQVAESADHYPPARLLKTTLEQGQRIVRESNNK